jgi:hypothetical protein
MPYVVACLLLVELLYFPTPLLTCASSRTCSVRLENQVGLYIYIYSKVLLFCLGWLFIYYVFIFV